VKHTTIARVLNDAIRTLRPDRVKFYGVLLLVTDAAPYMRKSSRRTFNELL
jgi:hypothetical protein